MSDTGNKSEKLTERNLNKDFFPFFHRNILNIHYRALYSEKSNKNFDEKPKKIHIQVYFNYVLAVHYLVTTALTG